MKGRNFKQSMLTYCKIVLRKMSFSKKLFLKEYRKSLSWLNPEERKELREWVRDSGKPAGSPETFRKLDQVGISVEQEQ